MANKPISSNILAGGRSSRMNGIDKGLLVYKGQRLVEHAIISVSSQVDDIIISANRNIEEYAGFGHRVISDDSRHFDGPLAGISSAVPYSRHDWIFIIPCDMPLLPASLVATLAQHTKDSKLVAISNDNHLQLVFLMHRSLRDSIKLYLSKGGHTVMRWLDSVDHRTVILDDVDYFYNINTPDQI
jgi:molybdopterin-guanine dinucleotide biosynthesis protein A